jgi:quercetin dioxygenase-like cupin family protein
MSAERFKKLKREPLLEKALPAANPPVSLVKGARIRFAPGQPSGIHQHPISTCGVVTEGQFVFQIDGEAEQTLNTGDAFFEPASTTILKFDNASGEVPAEIVCFYLADKTETPPIEMLPGGLDQQIGKAP